MSTPWRSSVWTTVRRPSFWLIVALVGNALVWLFIFNQSASFNPDVPQYLFGFRIGPELSMGLVFLEVAGVAVFGLMLICASVCALLRRLRRGSPLGLCAVCGYDLRATPDRCPECGSVSATARAADHQTPGWTTRAERFRQYRRRGRGRVGR